MTIVEAASAVNAGQRRRFIERVLAYCGGRPKPVTLAVWGLAFKSRTDDVREAPALDGIRAFRKLGAVVRTHDPEAMKNARAELGEDGISYHDDCYEAAEGADALVIFTDWQEFRTPDFDLLAARLRNKVIFDGRNLYEPAFVRKRGFVYHCVGRPEPE